jgi:hypothetical protein
MVNYITIIDFLLLIPYLALFYYFAKRISRKFTDTNLKGYFMTAFWLRMFGCIAYTLVIQFYYGYGDSIGFFRGSDFITNGILENPSNVKYLFASLSEISAWYNASPLKDDMFADYFAQPSGNLVMRISAALSFLSFNRFLIVSLFFAFFSFMGQWKLFTVFDDINQHKQRKLLAMAVLYTPSIWFWGSGLMKDSLCLGGLAFLVYYLYRFRIYKNISLRNTIFSVLLVLMIFTIKYYIIAILAATIVLTLVVIFLKSMKNVLLKVAFVTVTGLVAVGILIKLDVGSLISSGVEDAVTQIKGFQNVYELASDDDSSKGGFSFEEIDPSIGALLSRTPGIIFGTLYRPFIWESRKVMIFFTSLESTLLLFFTIYLLAKTKVVGFFKIIFTNEYLYFAFVLSILFAILIGFTTFNFGTMIRYKVIFLPFLYFLIVKIYVSCTVPKGTVIKQ